MLGRHAHLLICNPDVDVLMPIHICGTEERESESLIARSCSCIIQTADSHTVKCCQWHVPDSGSHRSCHTIRSILHPSIRPSDSSNANSDQIHSSYAKRLRTEWADYLVNNSILQRLLCVKVLVAIEVKLDLHAGHCVHHTLCAHQCLLIKGCMTAFLPGS